MTVFGGKNVEEGDSFACLAYVYLRCLGLIGQRYVENKMWMRDGSLWLASSVKTLNSLSRCECPLADRLVGYKGGPDATLRQECTVQACILSSSPAASGER